MVYCRLETIDMSGMNVILAMLHWWLAGCPAEARRAVVAGVFDAVCWLELSSTEKLACGFNCYTEMSAFTNKTEDAIKHMVVSKMCNFPSLKIGWWVHFSCVQVSKLKKQAPVDPNFALQQGNSRVLTFMSKLMRIVFSRFLYVLSGMYVCHCLSTRYMVPNLTEGLIEVCKVWGFGGRDRFEYDCVASLDFCFVPNSIPSSDPELSFFELGVVRPGSCQVLPDNPVDYLANYLEHAALWIKGIHKKHQNGLIASRMPVNEGQGNGTWCKNQATHPPSQQATLDLCAFENSFMHCINDCRCFSVQVILVKARRHWPEWRWGSLRIIHLDNIW